jgi:uncharacterized membrane protein
LSATPLQYFNTMKRIASIDITRGIVMVIMALDHVRDFMHVSSMTQSPTNLETTNAILFMTRWITHFCAPTFVFLSGVSAYISFKRNNNFAESRQFLLKRGIWLVILEFTFINFALWFDIHFRFEIMEVIAAIGLSFVVLSLFLKLPSRTIGIIGIVLIFSHDLLQGITVPSNPIVVFLSSVLFKPDLLPISASFSAYTAYPLIPWLGIMLTGFACGELFELSAEKRSMTFLRIGLTVLIMFTVLRFINIYGDPLKWSVQKSSLFTFLSFINTIKYPVSLLFTLLFVGLTSLVLSITEKINGKLAGILSVFGKVPLFYFVIHLYIIHSMMFIMLFLQGFKVNDLLFGAFNNGRPKAGGGVGLVVIYVIWVSVVVVLYPLCKWYGNYKSEHRKNKLLRYL